MGTNTTPENMRGLIIPTCNITKENIWPAQSTFTEKNPRAGVAKASQPYTGLTLSMAGSQSQDITVETVEGGTPGEKASFVWSGTDGIQLGQNSNNVITDWKYFSFGSGTAFYDDFAAVATDDGTLYWVQELENSGVYTIAVRRQKKNNSIEALQTLLTVTLLGAPNTTAKPAIAQLKDGSLIVTFFDYTGTDQVNLFVWRSYDNGDNWKEVSRRAMVENPILVGATGVFIDTTTLLVTDDIVSLVVGTRSKVTALGRNALVQFVSRDSGTTFFTLGNFGEDHAFPTAVSLPDGQQGFAYISATDTVSFLKIPHPGIAAAATDYTTQYEVDISSGAKTFATQTGTVLLGGTVAMWYQNERIFVVARDTDNDVYGWVSDDLGDTWNFISQNNTPGIDTALVFGPDSTTTIDNFKAVVWEGRALLMCNTFQSIAGMYLGGWSTVQHPALVVQPDRNQYVGFDANWIHNQVPDNSGHWSTSGAGTATVLQEGLRISTSTTVKQYNYAGNIYSNGFYRFKMRVETGTNQTLNYIALTLQNTDGANSYTIQMRFATSGFKVRDHSTQLADISIDLTKANEFMLFQSGVNVLLYYREWDEKQANKWTELVLNLGTQAPGLSARLDWGHIDLFTGSLQSYWSEMHVSEAGFGTPETEQRGGLYPSYGSYQYIDEGLLLSAKDSPARAEDQYTIEPRYDFPVEHIFHDVALSPRVVWRSVDDSSANRIAFFTDPVAKDTARSLGLSDVAGIHLNNINWRTGTLKSWNGASWDNIATIDTSENLQGSFKRSGATILPGASTKEFYLKYNEANGWRAALISGEDTFIVQIKQNSEGLFSNASDSKQCVLVIDTAQTDPATLPTTGTLKLMPTSISLIAELYQDAVSNVGAFAYAIEIDNQNTLEGYYQIGTMLWGNVYFMAPQYQRGRSISYDTNVMAYETNDGQYYARKMSNGRRTFRVGWTEPVDTRTIHALNPDYWQFNNTADAQPVAHYGDAIFGMMGIANYLSEQKPLVYLPAIPKDTANNGVYQFNRYHNQALVRTAGAVTMESVLGEEEQDEMFRLSTVNMVEVE
jgi:hypothetical protein